MTEPRREPIPVTPDTIPPRGWIMVEVKDRGRFWMDPAQLLVPPRAADLSRLSPAQKARIAAFKQVLGPLDPVSLDDTLANFALDQDPEPEIALWEHITAVFQDEVALRPTASLQERRLVFVAALSCANVHPSIDGLLAAQPALKALPHLARLVERFNAPRR